MSASSLSDEHGKRSAAPVNALRRFTQKRESARPATEMEHCELCNEPIPSEHKHLLNLASRALVCACQACSLLFSDEGAGGGKYKLIPRRYLALVDFAMTDKQWDELMIPVNMAFIFHSSGSKQIMAFYPSPAGATESLLNLEGWEDLLHNNPILQDMENDVEALLINRVTNANAYYIVPIDACYQLVGLIRLSWRGLSGGSEAKEAITNFFAKIQARSQPLKGGLDARSEL